MKIVYNPEYRGEKKKGGLEDIVVIDDFFDEDMQGAFQDSLEQTVKWELCQTSNKPEEFDQELFWFSDMTQGHADLIITNFFEKTKISDSVIYTRRYLNGQTSGQTAYSHGDNGYSLIYYPGRGKWNINWSGELIFYGDVNGRLDCTRAFIPSPNRAVFFPASILHKIIAPSRLMKSIRVSCAVKIAEI